MRLVFPDESDADSACVAWCGSAYQLVGQGDMVSLDWEYLLRFSVVATVKVTSGVEGAASYLTEAGLEQVRTEGVSTANDVRIR